MAITKWSAWTEKKQKSKTNNNVNEFGVVIGKNYTLLSFNDFGFLNAVHCKITAMSKIKYAQYDNAIQLDYIKKGGRKTYRRIITYSKNYIFEGHQNINTEIWINKEKKADCIIQTSRRCFDPEYIADALKSAKFAPIAILTAR